MLVCYGKRDAPGREEPAAVSLTPRSISRLAQLFPHLHGEAQRGTVTARYAQWQQPNDTDHSLIRKLLRSSNDERCLKYILLQ
ncbi:unnamed protein product [Cercopithifilaria johnstoni]|uniref:Uncharacterized protein n=1 Tax=Cercopithifilaria johnstoni TaxID=2874296 RepID=A0A8J2M640_9BILA|nr:unnamed protein product [Cercopithifilaria johnstoni]